MPELKLTDNQRHFVFEYLKDRNATRAYIAAGYGKAGAAQNASRMMRNDKVRKAIEAGLATLEAKLEISAERNLARLAEIAYADPFAKRTDILKACELIGKTFGQFKDVVESKNTHEISATDEQVDAGYDKFKKSL